MYVHRHIRHRKIYVHRHKEWESFCNPFQALLFNTRSATLPIQAVLVCAYKRWLIHNTLFKYQKKCNSGESESERFLPWAGWTRAKCCIASTKRQCLPSTWIYPVLHHFRQGKSLQTSKIVAIIYSCVLVLRAQHSFITFRDWWSKNWKNCAHIYQLTFKILIFILDISIALIKLNKCQVSSDISCSLKWTLRSNTLLKSHWQH